MRYATIPGLLAAILCSTVACANKAEDSTETAYSAVERADPVDARAIHSRASTQLAWRAQRFSVQTS